MAAVNRLGRLANAILLKNRYLQSCHISTTSALSAEWNFNWQPGPYPKTAEERAKEAGRYGLLPEDYKPLPDDGSGHGSYPELPWIGEAQKDPNIDWDDNARRRNFMDPVHLYYDMLVADRSDPSAPYYFSMGQMFLIYLVVFGGFFTALWFSWNWCKLEPMMDRERPHTDFHYLKQTRYNYDAPVKRNKHYTFEPVQ